MEHKKNIKLTTEVPPSGVRGLFEEYIKKENLFQPTDKLLLAVSGGIDSVVLCELCKQAGFNFSIAHCNFQLRGAESDADENFVSELAKKYAVEFFVNKFDTEKYAKENKLSIQVTARELRYKWFASIINPLTHQPFTHLLTAHHANDNIETLLISFFKGTGIGGLQGIQPKSGSVQHIIRPLLFAKKDELLHYAKEHDLAYRKDSSNDSNKYTRNYFRNKLIPSIKEIFPMVEDNLLDNIHRFNEINILYHQSVSRLKKKLVFEKNSEYHLPVLKLLKTEALHTIIFELTKEFNFTAGQVTGIIKLLKSESGKYVDSVTHRVLRNREWLIISKHGEKQLAHFLIEESDEEVSFSNYIIKIDRIDGIFKIDSDPQVAQLDAADIKFPLLLRKWKQGDYFYPLGMKKKKKLSRFFIDKKMSLTEKENTWVIEMNKKIIWVAGHRIDDRFKISANTKNILRLVLSAAK